MGRINPMFSFELLTYSFNTSTLITLIRYIGADMYFHTRTSNTRLKKIRVKVLSHGTTQTVSTTEKFYFLIVFRLISGHRAIASDGKMKLVNIS